MRAALLRGSLATVSLALASCAGLPHGDPLQVSVAGIDSLPGEGLEVRMALRLRVQNPNDAQVDYDGAYVSLSVQDRTFATGVSDATGHIPRFGESVISIPVTVSVLRLVGHVVGSAGGTTSGPIRFSLEGKLSGSGLSTYRFKSQGELQLPASSSEPVEPDQP